MSLGRVVERESDEVSESLKSFSVSCNCFLSLWLLLPWLSILFHRQWILQRQGLRFFEVLGMPRNMEV
jgi:hypothetical protein